MTTYSLGTFADKIRIASDTFDLTDGDLRHVRTRGGAILRAENGVRLWQGSVTLAPHYPSQLREVEALLRILQEPGFEFMVYDSYGAYPQMDPTGSGIAGASPVLSTVSSDGKSVGITGLPNGYQLKRGDRFAFAYGSSPTRYALHEILTPATASGGAVSSIRVVPAIRLGGAGAELDFVKPSLKAVVVPGSVKSGQRTNIINQGPSFSWIQTLR